MSALVDWRRWNKGKICEKSTWNIFKRLRFSSSHQSDHIRTLEEETHESAYAWAPKRAVENLRSLSVSTRARMTGENTWELMINKTYWKCLNENEVLCSKIHETPCQSIVTYEREDPWTAMSITVHARPLHWLTRNDLTERNVFTLKVPIRSRQDWGRAGRLPDLRWNRLRGRRQHREVFYYDPSVRDARWRRSYLRCTEHGCVSG